MKVTLKTAFSILDGRVSTKIDDVYLMLNYIFSKDLYTHQIGTAIEKLKEINPRWYAEGVEKLNYIKEVNNTNDFQELMKIIDAFFSDYEVELQKIDKEEIDFLEKYNGFK